MNIITIPIFGAMYYPMYRDMLGGGTVSTPSTMSILLLIPLTIVMAWIGLAIAVKRWHDRGKSGWWILITFVPFIGSIWYLIECGFLAGTPSVNQYGVENQPPTDPFNQPTEPLDEPTDPRYQ